MWEVSESERRKSSILQLMAASSLPLKPRTCNRPEHTAQPSPYSSPLPTNIALANRQPHSITAEQGRASPRTWW
jgi:hypothetical protein